MLSMHDAAFHAIVQGLGLFTISSQATGLGVLESTRLTLVLYFTLSKDYSMSAKMLMHPKVVNLGYLSAPCVQKYGGGIRYRDRKRRDTERDRTQDVGVRKFNGRDASLQPNYM